MTIDGSVCARALDHPRRRNRDAINAGIWRLPAKVER
jgi:hypothetical protein